MSFYLLLSSLLHSYHLPFSLVNALGGPFLPSLSSVCLIAVAEVSQVWPRGVLFPSHSPTQHHSAEPPQVTFLFAWQTTSVSYCMSIPDASS